MKKEKVLFCVLIVFFIVITLIWAITVLRQQPILKGVLILRTVILLAPVSISLIGFYYSELRKSNKSISKRIISFGMISIAILILIINFYFISDPQLSEARLKDIEQKISNLDYRTRSITTDEYGNINIGNVLKISAGIDEETKDVLDKVENYQKSGKCEELFSELNKIKDKIQEPWRIYSDTIYCYLKLNKTKDAWNYLDRLKKEYPNAPNVNYYAAIKFDSEYLFEEALTTNLEGENKVQNDEYKSYFLIQRQGIYIDKGIWHLNKCAIFTPFGQMIYWQVLNINECYLAEESFQESIRIGENENLTEIAKESIIYPQDIINKNKKL